MEKHAFRMVLNPGGIEDAAVAMMKSGPSFPPC